MDFINKWGIHILKLTGKLLEHKINSEQTVSHYQIRTDIYVILLYISPLIIQTPTN